MDPARKSEKFWLKVLKVEFYKQGVKKKMEENFYFFFFFE